MGPAGDCKGGGQPGRSRHRSVRRGWPGRAALSLPPARREPSANSGLHHEPFSGWASLAECASKGWPPCGLEITNDLFVQGTARGPEGQGAHLSEAGPAAESLQREQSCAPRSCVDSHLWGLERRAGPRPQGQGFLFDTGIPFMDLVPWLCYPSLPAGSRGDLGPASQGPL